MTCILDKDLRPRLERLVPDLPHPLGTLLSKPLGTDNADRRHESLLRAWEGVFRVSACALWACARSAGLTSARFAESCRKDDLRRPSFGRWTTILREARVLLEAQGEKLEPAFPRPLLFGLGSPFRCLPGLAGIEERLAALPTGRILVTSDHVFSLVDVLSSYRNRTLGHDSVDSAFKEASNGPLLLGLVEYLELCPPLGSARVCVVQTVSLRGGNYYARIVILQGSFGTFEEHLLSERVARDLILEQPSLFVAPELFVPLSPMAAVRRESDEWILGWYSRHVHGARFAYETQGAPLQWTASPDDAQALLAGAPEEPALSDEILGLDPWLGLLPYEQRHAELFIGREEECALIQARLERERFLIIAGPSGSGKSSILRAGVLPVLDRDSQESGRLPLVVLIRPGADPLGALQRGFQQIDLPGTLDPASWWGLVDQQLRVGPDRSLAEGVSALCDFLLLRHGRLVLAIDQLEELTTVCTDPDISLRFLDLLVSLAAKATREPLLVLATIRSDLLGSVATHPRFGALVERHVFFLGKMTAAGLRRVVTAPLRGRRVEIEPQLTEALLSEIGDQPGNLALLSHVLLQLWRDRARFGNRLSYQAYLAAGRLSGALRQQAEQAVSKLESVMGAMDPPTWRVELEAVLLQLLVLADSGTLLKRQVLLDRLTEATGISEHRLRCLLDPFLERRLVVLSSLEQTVAGSLGGERVELAHEALLDAWPALRELAQRNSEIVKLRQDVEEAAGVWKQQGRKGELWTDATSRLRRAEELNRLGSLHLLPIERAFLAASRRRVSAWKAGIACGLAALVLTGFVSVGLWLRAESADQRAASAERESAFERQKEALSARERGETLEALALLRASLENGDSLDMRALWLTLRRTPLRWTLQMNSEVAGLAFSPDGRRLAIAAASPRIRVVDAWTRETLSVLECGPGVIYAVAWSPDGKHLASGTNTGQLQVWDIDRGTCRDLKPDPAGVEHAHTGIVSSVAFNVAGTRLLSGGFDKSVSLWDLVSGERIRVFRGHQGLVTSVAFGPGEKNLASSSQDGSVRFWDPSSEKELSRIEANSELTEVAFDASGDRIATSGFDGYFSIWHAPQRQLLSKRGGLGSRLYAVAWRRERIAAASEREVFLWEQDGAREAQRLGEHLAEVQDVVFDSSAELMASGSMDWTVKLWDLEMNLDPLPDRGHEQVVSSARFSPDGSKIVSSGWDGTVRVWDARTGRQEHVLAGVIGRVQDALFDPQGRTIVAAGSDALIHLWNTESWRPIQNLRGHPNAISSLGLSPDGAVLASSAWDSKVRLWSTRDWSLLREVDNAGPSSQVFSADGALLVRGDAQGYLMAFDTRTGALVRETQVVKDAGIVGVDRLGQGGAFAWLSGTGVLGLWDPKTREHRELVSLGSQGWWLSARPDGSELAVATNQAEILLVKVADGSVRRLDGHSEMVSRLAWSLDGSMLVSAGFDGTVRTWDPERALPRWRGVALLGSPGAFFTQAGWEPFDPTGATPIGEWSRSITETTLHAAQSPDGEELCVQDGSGRIELWSLSTDKRLGTWESVPLKRLLAMSGACVGLDAGLRLFSPSSPEANVLLSSASSLDATHDGFIVSSQGDLILYMAQGQERRRLIAVGDIVGAVELDFGYIVADSQGGMKFLSEETNRARVEVHMQDAPSSPPTRMIEGPGSSLVAGFRDGSVGLWNPRSGRRLLKARLHGPILELLSKDSSLHILSALGDHESLDLSALTADYCDLMREVWSRVPVRWEGRPRIVEGHAPHLCDR